MNFDSRRFRTVLGSYPTGVVIVTAVDSAGLPCGMVIGSFSSVSLDPPLVSFCAASSSKSFARMRSSASFCVNVVSHRQEALCRAFASSAADKFAGFSWELAPSGVPRIPGAAAWVDCDLEQVIPAGDHFLVLGRVTSLDSDPDALPLIFFQGGYGRFSPASFITMPEPDLFEQLKLADLARGHMERASAEFGAECVAIARVGTELVVVAAAGAPAGSGSRIGWRGPFAAPLGSLFLVGAGDGEVQAWMDAAGHPVSDAQRAAYGAMLERVRTRRWMLTLASDAQSELERALYAHVGVRADQAGASLITKLSERAAGCYEPDIAPDDQYAVQMISVPVVAEGGCTRLLMSIWGFPGPLSGSEIAAATARLRKIADDVASLAAARRERAAAPRRARDHRGEG